MNALLFTLALFTFWGLVGFATISIFPPRLRLIQGILISPAIGIAVTILPVFFINRAGIPVKDFGGILLPVLAALAILAIIIKRPLFPAKKCLPFIGILIAALLLVAWPMFLYDFDWLSYCNDDMANYCLAAQRFLNHGFFDLPNIDDIFSGRDYSHVYWFMHVASECRSGSELMLSAVWAFSGLNAHQIFMPVIAALHLALVTATGATVAGFDNNKKAPLIAMALMAIAPLVTLGTLYQLIGQAGGLVLLCAAVVLMFRPQRARRSVMHYVLSSIPAMLIFSALFVWYPEVLPFLGLGWLTYLLLLFRANKRKAVGVILPSVVVGMMVLLVLNKYVISALIFMFSQASGGMQSCNLNTLLFPCFLAPIGLPAFWGLLPIVGSFFKEPFISLLIGVSIVLFYWLFRRVIPSQLKQALPSVSMFIVMAIIAPLLFFRNNDFGLFKLSMYAQPFFTGVLAVNLSGLIFERRKLIVRCMLLVVLSIVIYTQLSYVLKSTGEYFGGLSEIPRASSQKINRHFQEFLKSLKKIDNNSGYYIDTSNVVLLKCQSLYSQNKSLLFIGKEFYSGIFHMPKPPVLPLYVKSILSDFKKTYVNYWSSYTIETVSGKNKFSISNKVADDIANRKMLVTINKQNIFNRFIADSIDEYFLEKLYPINCLLFIESDFGANYYFAKNRRDISFYQLESDPMFAGQELSLLGKHMLFLVVNPSPNPRVMLELTSTVAKQFLSELPKPIVQQSTVNFVGRGTGRVFSEPIAPTIINNTPYVSIDMGRASKQFPNKKHGLMLLYGREIPDDSRWLTTFGRDISMISEGQYQALSPPVSLQNFPADLANKNLEYSGIYEDGWVSEHSFFVLSPAPEKRFLVVKGFVPKINDLNFSTELTVSINGKEAVKKKIGIGDFELKVPADHKLMKQRIELVFSKYQQLAGLDGRIIGGKIKFIGFTDN